MAIGVDEPVILHGDHGGRTQGSSLPAILHGDHGGRTLYSPSSYFIVRRTRSILALQEAPRHAARIRARQLRDCAALLREANRKGV
jgi:hypothetical protein